MKSLPRYHFTSFLWPRFLRSIMVLGKPKCLFFAILLLLFLLSGVLGPTSISAEDFSEDEFVEEESDTVEEEASTTPTPSPTVAPTQAPTPTPTAGKEDGQVLGGATELGDTGAEQVVFLVAGLVGLVVIIAGFKVAHSNVEE